MVTTPLLPAQFAALPQPLYVFDGVCVLCNGAVGFLLKRDRSGSIRFAAAQGPTGQALYRALGMKSDAFETFLFIDGGRVYAQSAAIFRFLRYLAPWWRIFSVFALLPAPWADWAYRKIAANRYRLFGKHDACTVPRPEWRHRFID